MTDQLVAGAFVAVAVVVSLLLSHRDFLGITTFTTKPLVNGRRVEMGKAMRSWEVSMLLSPSLGHTARTGSVNSRPFG